MAVSAQPSPRGRAIAPHRTIVVPVTGSSGRAVAAAASLAARDGAAIHLLHVLEVPRELPLDAHFPDEEHAAWTLLRNAQALVESYGAGAVVSLERARSAADAVVARADMLDADLLVVGVRGPAAGRHSLLGRTAAAILHHAECRVMVVRERQSAR